MEEVAMSNLLIYLIGFAGVGKYTIAKALSESLEARIVDNHYVNNPIFGLIAQDGVTPLPPGIWTPGIWTQVLKVREAILETIATLSPKDWNFILTNELTEDEEDEKLYRDVLEVAKRRSATFIPVRLTCETDELCWRITMPERRARMKDSDPHRARFKSQTYTVYQPKHPNTLELEVTTLSPEEAASAILRHIRGLKQVGAAF
jgi:predicted kinase